MTDKASGPKSPKTSEGKVGSSSRGRSKFVTKWKKRPVGIRGAYIGGVFVIAGAIISGFFVLAATLLSVPAPVPTSTQAPVSTPTPSRSNPSASPKPGFVPFSTIYSSSKVQIPCSGMAQSTAGLTPYNSQTAPFQANIYRLYEYIDGLAFPGVPSPSEIRTPADSRHWLSHHRGYEVNESILDLTITAHHAIKVLQMRAFVIRCNKVAAGSLFMLPPASSFPPRFWNSVHSRVARSGGTSGPLALSSLFQPEYIWDHGRT